MATKSKRKGPRYVAHAEGEDSVTDSRRRSADQSLSAEEIARLLNAGERA